MTNDVKEILVSKEEIALKVKELGEIISRDYEGKDLLLIAVLKGVAVFMADIMRAITIPLCIDFMAVSSYGSSTKTSGVVKIIKDLDKPIEGKDVLIIEDILDSGMTLSYLKDVLKGREPNSIKICALLDKKERRQVDIEADYVGFEIPDKFVVGYGLDFNDKYRNVPDVAVLNPKAYM